MKGYLLLFFSTLLLLFSLPENGRPRNSYSATQRSELKKTCSSRRLARHTCRKKCLKHRSHPQQQATGSATDCSQQLYAVVTSPEHDLVYHFPDLQKAMLPVCTSYRSPSLEAEPDPPRFL